MREITSHKVNGLNEAIEILVLDEPGQGNACHEYEITFYGKTGRRSKLVQFQNGPIAEAGVNGISNESLLAIVEDRLIGFQAGQFACPENALALSHVHFAMTALKRRTIQRVARGVEGTNAK